MAASKSVLELQEKAKKIVSLLKKNYPNSKCSLIYESPFQLLVATVLSAQCTDERVNKVTPVLFRSFPTPERMALASVEELEELVRSTGFYKNKARALKALSEELVLKYKGQLPKKIEDLIQLRGVGRKTANVVLGNAFGIASGVVVDTHVGRISRRLGLTKEKHPEKVELALNLLIAKKDWVAFSHLLIDHGRALCTARTQPRCEQCFLQSYCLFYLKK